MESLVAAPETHGALPGGCGLPSLWPWQASSGRWIRWPDSWAGRQSIRWICSGRSWPSADHPRGDRDPVPDRPQVIRPLIRQQIVRSGIRLLPIIAFIGWPSDC